MRSRSGNPERLPGGGVSSRMRPGGRELVSWGKGVLGRGNSSSRLTPVLTLAQPPPRRASPHAGLLPWTSPRASTLRIQCGLSLFPNLLLLLGPRLCGALPCPHPRVGDLDVGFIPCLLPPDPLSGQSLGPTYSPSAAFLPSVPTFLPVALPPPWSPGIPHHIPSLGSSQHVLQVFAQSPPPGSLP